MNSRATALPQVTPSGGSNMADDYVEAQQNVIDSLQKLVKSQQHKVKGLEEELSAQQIKGGAQGPEVEALQARSATLQSQNDALRARTESQGERLEELKRELDTAIVASEDARARIESLEAQNSNKDREISRLHARADLKESIITQQQEESRQEREKMAETSRRLETKLKSVSTARSRLRDEVAALRAPRQRSNIVPLGVGASENGYATRETHGPGTGKRKLEDLAQAAAPTRSSRLTVAVPGSARTLHKRTSQPIYHRVLDSDDNVGDWTDSDKYDSDPTNVNALEPSSKKQKVVAKTKTQGRSPAPHIPYGCELVGASFARKSIARVFGGNLHKGIVNLITMNDLEIDRMAFYRFDMNIKAPRGPLDDGYIFVGLTHEAGIGASSQTTQNDYELFMKYTDKQRREYGEDVTQGERWKYLGTYQFQRIQPVPKEEWAGFEDSFKNKYTKLHASRLREETAGRLRKKYDQGLTLVPQVKAISKGYNDKLQSAIREGKDRRM